MCFSKRVQSYQWMDFKSMQKKSGTKSINVRLQSSQIGVMDVHGRWRRGGREERGTTRLAERLEVRIRDAVMWIKPTFEPRLWITHTSSARSKDSHIARSRGVLLEAVIVHKIHLAELPTTMPGVV
jgi:hypothetical protein